MLCIGAPGYYHTGSAYNTCDIFDFDTNPSSANPWSTADTDFPAYNGGGTGTIDLISGYDSATGKAWGIGKGNSQKIGSYTVSSGAWTSYDINNPQLGGNSKAGLDPNSSLLVFLNTSGVPYAVDLRSTPSIFAPSTTGTGPGEGAMALDWDNENGRFACWAKTGKTVYFLTPGADPYSGGDSWTWTSNTPSTGGTPAGTISGRVFGRFRTVSTTDIKGYLLMSVADGAMHFYRTA
jgi:hypothetical protein